MGQRRIETKRAEAKQALIDKVVRSIIKDVSDGDVTVLEVILRNVPNKVLKASLPESN